MTNYEYEIEVCLDGKPLFKTIVSDIPTLKNVHRELSQQFHDIDGTGKYKVIARERKTIISCLSPYEIYHLTDK
jgi:hypothetical protein